jgi:hypothetical protein
VWYDKIYVDPFLFLLVPLFSYAGKTRRLVVVFQLSLDSAVYLLDIYAAQAQESCCIPEQDIASSLHNSKLAHGRVRVCPL